MIGRGVYYILYIYYISARTFFYLSKYSLSDAHFSTGRLLFEFNRLQYTLAAPEVFVSSANPVILPSGYRVSIVRNTNIDQIETTPLRYCMLQIRLNTPTPGTASYIAIVLCRLVVRVHCQPHCTKQYSVVQCRVFSPQSMHFPIVWCLVYIHFAACSLTTNLQSTIATCTLHSFRLSTRGPGKVDLHAVLARCLGNTPGSTFLCCSISLQVYEAWETAEERQWRLQDGVSHL